MKQRAAELRAEGKKGAKKADALQATLDSIDFTSGLSGGVESFRPGHHFADTSAQAYSLVLNGQSFAGFRYEQTGFVADPYPEYSEAFFGGGYRVLRGGSWATRSRTATATFRNCDFPQRRQIFSGFRVAR